MGVSYRVLEGYLKGSWEGECPAPEFTTMWKRMGKTMPRFEQDTISGTVEGNVLRLAIDATGITLHNRGEWIREKWNVKRGFLKMHLLINLDTRRIMSFSITDMNGGDAGQLPVVLDKLLKKVHRREPSVYGPTSRDCVRCRVCWHYGHASPPWPKTAERMDASKSADDGEIGAGGVMAAADEALLKCRHLEQTGIAIEMCGDGGYDTRKIFSLLAKLGIAPIIKVRINSNARAGGVDRARAMAVLEQLGGKGGCTNRNLNRMKSERLANQKDWKKKVGYGLRWIVEIVISAFKRVFGGSVRALTPRTTYIEIATKVAAYNHSLDIGDDAIQKMKNMYEIAKLPREQLRLPEAAA